MFSEVGEGVKRFVPWETTSRNLGVNTLIMFVRTSVLGCLSRPVPTDFGGKGRDKKRATEKIRRPVGVMESYLESYAPFRVFLESYRYFLESYGELLESYHPHATISSSPIWSAIRL